MGFAIRSRWSLLGRDNSVSRLINAVNNFLLRFVAAMHFRPRERCPRNAVRGFSAFVGWALSLAPVAGQAHEQTRHSYEASLRGADPVRVASAESLRPAGPAEPAPDRECRVQLRLVDADNGRDVPGLIRIRDGQGRLVPLVGLLNRGVRLPESHPGRQWHVLAEAAELALPGQALVVEAIGGLETEMTRQAVDLVGKSTAVISVPVKRFFGYGREAWRSGNTHLHLEGVTRAQADEYLRLVPAADGVDFIFVSHLSQARPDDSGRRSDLGWISNTYSAAELHAMSNPAVRYGWGEEMRHAFPGDAYGHVLLLNMARLIEPVSIGWSLNITGPDYPPLRTGLAAARREGGTTIWCHYERGFEGPPNFFQGGVDALNMYDSQRPAAYSDRYYRLLNLGLKVPFSTGTDWFISDFSRVYVRVSPDATRESWLEALRAGRTFITNGTLMELRAGGHQVGDTVALDSPQRMTFTARAAGRNHFTGIDLVHNGRVVGQADCHREGGHFAAGLTCELPIDGPGWVALRVRCGSFDTDSKALPFGNVPVYGAGPGFNEMGMRLFGHTSPIYLEYRGRRIFDATAARSFVTEIEEAVRHLNQHAKFDTDAQRAEVQGIYAEAIEWLRRRIAETEFRSE